MTIDEAIAKAEYVAGYRERCAEHTVTKKAKESISKSAAESKQLAEWLRELKEAKRLLKAAVEDINSYVDCYEAHCDECCCTQDNHCHWKHEEAALKLIGETNDEP